MLSNDEKAMLLVIAGSAAIFTFLIIGLAILVRGDLC